MAKTVVIYAGGNTEYQFPFDYLRKEFVKVSLVAADGTPTDKVYGSDYTVTDRKITLKVASDATGNVRIWRSTTTNPITVFSDASVLRARTLNALDTQLLHIAEENSDAISMYGMSFDKADNTWQGMGRIIKNVKNPLNPQDVVTLNYLDSVGVARATQMEALAAQITADKSNSEVAAAAALVSEKNAKTSETNAKVSETASKNSETNAKASETASKTSETNAKVSETASKTSETNAKVSETASKTSETNAMGSAAAAAASAKAAALFDSSLYAPLASPAFTGTPTAPTAASGTSTTQLATTEFVGNAVGNVRTPVIFNSFQSVKVLVTSNTGVTITTSNNPYTNSGSISLSISTATNGAGGIDTGSIAASTWYYVYVIYGTSGTSGIISTSGNPTLPSGYTLGTRVGCLRTNSSGYLYRTLQYGRKVRYIVDGTIITNYPIIASGASGSDTALTACSISNVVPETASFISLILRGGSAANSLAAPSANFSGGVAGTNSPPLNTASTTSTNFNLMGDFLLESTSVYYFSSGSAGALLCAGWEDNL